MTDNTELYPGTGGDMIATRDIAGVKHPLCLMEFGEAGTATPVDASNPLPAAPPLKTDLLYRFLDTVGDGSGTKNANGNYSGGATQFFIAPSGSDVYHVERLIITIEDTTGAQIQEYGNLGAALTNGVLLEKRQGASTQLLDLVDGVPIKTNGLWASFCYETVIKGWNSGNDMIVATWDFSRTGGALRLDAANSERLTIILEDDLSGLVGHYFQAQGHVV